MEIQEKLNALFWRAEHYGAYTNLGVASLYKGLIGAMLKYSWKTTFVSSGPMNLPKVVNYKLIKHSNLLKNLPEILNLPYNFRSSKEIINIINEINPSFLLQHNHDFNYGASIVKRETGIPVFIHCDGVEYWIKKNWGKLYFGNLLKWAEEIQWDNADKIIVVSELIRNQLIDFGVDSAKIIVSPNGVDTEIFKKNNTNFRNQLELEGKFVCGFAGSFGNWHGVDTIAKSVKHLVKLIPNVKVLLIGDGDLRPQLEEIIKKDNVENHVILTGLVDYKDIPTYLSTCDVLMTPCKSNEDNSGFFNSPIKLFEYMSMGLPVVATNVGQQGDIYKKVQFGELIEERNPSELAESIKNIYDNYEYFVTLANQARNFTVRNFDWKQNVHRIYKAYQELMGVQT